MPCCLLGTRLDERTEIVNPIRVDWEAGGAFVAPPGMWHAAVAGFVPDEVALAPPVAVARLAERLGDPALLEGYGRREQTRSDHLRLVADYLGWKSTPAGGEAMKDLEQPGWPDTLVNS